MKTLFEECKECEYWNNFYGCTNYGDCELYQEQKAEKEIDFKIDKELMNDRTDD